MDLGLDGKVAVVCASTSGLGAASARALAREGARVVVTGRSEDKGHELVRQISAEAGHAVFQRADYLDEDAPALIVQKAILEFGSVDIAVLNGPGPHPGGPENIEPTDAISAITTLVEPHIRLLQLILPSMREAGWGRIIAIGSTAVEIPSMTLTASSMGRGALAAYLKALATKEATKGITVNMVHPGLMDTARIVRLDEDAAKKEGISVDKVRARREATLPMGRLGSPEEYGDVVAFLASQRASYVTGTAVRVDGGMTPIL